jgi:hypothetical protein
MSWALSFAFTRSALARRPCAIILVLTAGLSFAVAGWSAENPYGPSSFKILDPATSKLLGQVHFTVTEAADGGQTVRSDARYLNGDYDSEEDHLVPSAKRGPLRQVTFSHSFFHPDGSPDRSSQANFLTGRASCTTIENGRAVVQSADFEFGTDTYAGVIVPLRDALMSKAARPAEFHYFACVPGPRVVSVRGSANPPAPWRYASATVMKVDLQPDFGWINVIIAPFLPSVAAWFDPSRQWYLAGVESARYYKGAKILMVADAPLARKIPGATHSP